jgi:hypothetical protein
MIKRSIFRLLCAGGLGLLGVSLLSGDSGSAFGAGFIVGAAVWSLLELFILSALLFFYGITGLAHDIGAAQEHDPWHRW